MVFGQALHQSMKENPHACRKLLYKNTRVVIVLCNRRHSDRRPKSLDSSQEILVNSQPSETGAILVLNWVKLGSNMDITLGTNQFPNWSPWLGNGNNSQIITKQGCNCTLCISQFRPILAPNVGSSLWFLYPMLIPRKSHTWDQLITVLPQSDV